MSQATERSVLENAEMSEDSRSMCQALLDGDLMEARFRAKLVHHQALQTGDVELEGATALVVELLGPPGSLPKSGCGAAVLAVSVLLGHRVG